MVATYGVRKRAWTAEELRQQAVAGDGVGDAGLAHHHHQHHRGQAGDGADFHERLQPGQGRVGLQRGRHRLVGAQQVVRHHAGQHRTDDDVDDGAHGQRAEQADRHVALRVLGFTGSGGDRIEADVREEHDGGGAEDAAPAELTRHAGVFRNERVPVGRVDVGRADADEQADDGDLDRHDDRVDERRLGHAHVQQAGYRRHDQHRRQVEQLAGGDELAAGPGDGRGAEQVRRACAAWW